MQYVINLLPLFERRVHDDPVEALVVVRWINFQTIATQEMHVGRAVVFFPEKVEKKAIEFAIIRGSILSFFIREMSVVRLMPMPRSRSVRSGNPAVGFSEYAHDLTQAPPTISTPSMYTENQK